MLNYLGIRYLADNSESCVKSFFRGSKKKSLKKEIDNMTDASYPTGFRVKSNLFYISSNFID
jgi:hypothetical protein